MFNMIIGKRSHRIIRMVIIRLISHSQSLLLSNLLSRCLEVFRQQLALFVEVVASALYPVYQYRKFRCKYLTDNLPHQQGYPEGRQTTSSVTQWHRAPSTSPGRHQDTQ